MGDALAHCFHDAGRFMAQQEGVGILDVALLVGEVGVADPQAWIFTMTSFGPGSGIWMVVSSTGSPFAREITA